LKPRFIALNILFAAILLAIAWQARLRWDEAQARRRANLNVPVKVVTPPPVMPADKPQPVTATKYADVAQKNLFSKDRNPTVVIEPPKPAEPPKQMPPLPVVFGVLGLPSGTKAIMAEKSGAASRSVHSGDTVGEFKIVALDSKTVTFDWEHKQVTRNIEDLIDRSNRAESAPQSPVSGQPAAAASSSGPAMPIPAPPAPQIQSNAPPVSKDLGTEIGAPGASMRACVASDHSPAGSVVDGYKKVTEASPFGQVCRWVPVK
jgi:hypothetical protein